MLPIGLSDVPQTSTLKMYCQRCQDVYAPTKQRHESIDGAFFGSSFAHMFVVNYPTLFSSAKQEFVGTIYGFRLHESSMNHPAKVVYSTISKSLERVRCPSPHFEPFKHQGTRIFIANVSPDKE